MYKILISLILFTSFTTTAMELDLGEAKDSGEISYILNHLDALKNGYGHAEAYSFLHENIHLFNDLSEEYLSYICEIIVHLRNHSDYAVNVDYLYSEYMKGKEIAIKTVCLKIANYMLENEYNPSDEFLDFVFHEFDTDDVNNFDYFNILSLTYRKLFNARSFSHINTLDILNYIKDKPDYLADFSTLIKKDCLREIDEKYEERV